MEIFVWLLMFALSVGIIISFRLLLAQTYVTPLAMMLHESNITHKEFQTHFRSGIFYADLFNLLDWTPYARARFIFDRVYLKLHGKWPNYDEAD